MFEILNQEQGSSIICKDKSNIIRFILNLKQNNIYNFNFKIYYQDLIFNWYEQNLDLKYDLTNIISNSNTISINHFKVRDEVLLNGVPVDLKIGNNSRD